MEKKGEVMDKKLTPELKKMKDEYDFLQKRISDLI